MPILINPGTTPQVYTADGRTLPAGERVEVSLLDDTAQTAVACGRIVLGEELESTKNGAEDRPSDTSTSVDGRDAGTDTAAARRSRKAVDQVP